MEDPSLILILRAKSLRCSEMWKHEHNRAYYQPSDFGPEQATKLQSEKATSLVSANDFGRDAFCEPELRLTFDHPPKNPGFGFVFGSNPEVCDVYIGAAHEGFSGRTFSINFNTKGEIVLHSTSVSGAIVTYNDQPSNSRKFFKWIMFAGIGITVQGLHELTFEVVVPKHEQRKQEYESRRMEMTASISRDVPMHLLDIKSRLSTTRVSRASTFTQEAMYVYGEEIRRGSFGVVHIARNASTGLVCAAKRFNGKSEDYANEVELLESIPDHDHIVGFIGFTDEVGVPTLIMEYVPEQTLQKQASKQRMTAKETVLLLYQSLQAVDFIHSMGLMHRDIKPDNILFQTRSPLHVKIADFGLATAKRRGGSHCGTPMYVAKEVFESEKYSNAVDVWSLGLVVLFCLDGLPSVAGPNFGLHWCRVVASHATNLETYATEPLCRVLFELLTKDMLRYEPQDRSSAAICLAKLSTIIQHLENSDDSQSSGVQTSTQQSLSRPHMANVDNLPPINQPVACYEGTVRTPLSWHASNSNAATLSGETSVTVPDHSVAQQKEPESYQSKSAGDAKRSSEDTGGSVTSASTPTGLAPAEHLVETPKLNDAPKRYNTRANAKRDAQEALRRG